MANTNNQNERVNEIFDEIKKLIRELGEINEAKDQNDFGVFFTISQNDEENNRAKVSSAIIGSTFLLAHAMDNDDNFRIANKAVDAYRLLGALTSDDE